MTPDLPDSLYGIIGHPLGHTMSPKLHNWGFAREGLASVYMRFPTPPEKLKDFVTAMRTLPIHGVSVTIPHKETIIPLLDAVTPLAAKVGAVNTLFWDDGKLTGDNTDITGFLHPLKESLRKAHCGKVASHALILGAGGAAKAVIAGLQEMKIPQITITNRSEERAKALAEQFGCHTVSWDKRAEIPADLVINTTPLGMSGDNLQASPWPQGGFAHVEGLRTAYDLVYNPLRTVFLQQAAEAGWQTIDGLHMFAAQGIEQFRIWTGRQLPQDDVRELIIRELGL